MAAARARSSAVSAAVLASALAGAVATTSAASSAETAAQPERHSWELRLLAGDWYSLQPGQEEATAWPVLQKAAARKPLLVLRPEDVESYVWSVQRITLREGATRRLLAAQPKTGFEQWWIPHYPFAVMVDGEFLYAGVFDGPMSQMTMDFPVIHAELVDGRAVLHLLPKQQSWGFDPRFEESVGGGSGLLGDFLAETEPFDAATDREEPNRVRARFRPLLRDPRIHVVFASLGTLIEAPPPPPDEDVLLVADRAIDAARAARQPSRIQRQLADDYHLFYPFGYRLGMREHAPMDKKEAVELFGDGWKPGKYGILATETKVAGDEGIVYTLFYLRGKVDGDEESIVVLARRRYRREGTGWRLVMEVHHKCIDDDPRWRSIEEIDKYMVMLEGPCWPPPWNEKEPPVPPPGELVE